MSEPRNGFWFASVGGAPTEVVRIHGGLMFSTGCADGHSLEGVELIERIEDDAFPLPKRKREAAERRWQAQLDADHKRGVWHNYRTFP